MIQRIGQNFLSFGASELKSAREAYSQKMDDIRQVQTQAQDVPPQSDEPAKKLDVQA